MANCSIQHHTFRGPTIVTAWGSGLWYQCWSWAEGVIVTTTIIAKMAIGITKACEIF